MQGRFIEHLAYMEKSNTLIMKRQICVSEDLRGSMDMDGQANEW